MSQNEKRNEIREIKALCALCNSKCPILVHVQNNRLMKFTTDKTFTQESNLDFEMGAPWAPDHCPRAMMVREWFYSFNRTKFPLKRIGERGEGKWEKISWEQALNEIAQKLEALKRKDGSRCIASTIDRPWSNQEEWKLRFLNLLGVPWNFFGRSQICRGPRGLSAEALMGWYSDFANEPTSKCTVFWGAEFFASHPYRYTKSVEAKQRGGKIIVVDIKKTHSAKRADIFLQPRCGTDAALALSWIYVIINEKLYDDTFVREWTNAPLLIRCDKNRLLRESDLSTDGDIEKFIIWDANEQKEIVHNRDKIRYPCRNPSLQVNPIIRLADGQEVQCTTVWQNLVHRVNKYSPEVVAKITGVPPEKIREAAITYATYKPGSIIAGKGTEQSYCSVQTIHAINILCSLTGNIDIEGGEELAGPPEKFITNREIELNEQNWENITRDQIGSDSFRLHSWRGQEKIDKNVFRVWGNRTSDTFITASAHTPTMWRTIISGKPYKIRALLSSSGNTLISQPNTSIIYKAIKEKIDLLVVMDCFMTPIAELADYVLPAASFLERPALFARGHTLRTLHASPRVLDPIMLGEYDRRDDYYFWSQLGIRLEQEKYWPWKTLEEAYDHRLKPMGYTFNELATKIRRIKPIKAHREKEYKKYERIGFATTSGKIELYSSILEELGYDTLPYYEEPPESPISRPDLLKDYPITLTQGSRYQIYWCTDSRDCPSIRTIHPDPIVQINPETARQYGIDNGDWVWIENIRGKILQKAKYSEDIPLNLIDAQYAWWYPELPGEEPWLHGLWISNINMIVDDDPAHCNPIIGTWPIRPVGLCKIYKAKKLPSTLFNN